MKHVFVETNFLISLLRPFPELKQGADRLLQRHKNGELTIYVPWCSAAEASRTLDRVIKEDLGFYTKMMEFTVGVFTQNPSAFKKPEIDKLHELARHEKATAMATKNQRIHDLAQQLKRIEPCERVIRKTLEVFNAKSLNPFDEMVLGAVLARAEDLYLGGETDLHFCTLDHHFGVGDKGFELQAAYRACGLELHHSFDL